MQPIHPMFTATGRWWNYPAMLMLLVYSVLVSACAPQPSSVSQAQEKAEQQQALPETFIWNSNSLINARKKFQDGDSEVQSVVANVVSSAETALKNKPRSVIDSKSKYPSPSGDQHDYFSTGPYWWPNPATPDGKPYIRRDGEKNPDYAKSDHPAMALMIDSVRQLALAWWFTADERYAEHAVRLLEVWFIDPQTKMNPNMRHAQAIPGINDGRAIGMIDAARMYELIDSIQVLKNSPALTPQHYSQLRGWFAQYLDWYLQSDFGKELRAAKNNIASWYFAQIGAYAAFTGQLEEVKPLYQQNLPALLQKQITADGRQPEELARTNPMSYSVYNLLAWECIASVAELMGLDYRSADSAQGQRLNAALSYLGSYASTTSTWPHPELNNKRPPRAQLTPLFIRAQAAAGPAASAELVETTRYLQNHFPAPAWLKLAYGSAD